MGAFGELLNQYFGGTKHDVRTWGACNNQVNKTVVSEASEAIEADRILLERIEEKATKLAENFEMMLLKIDNDDEMDDSFRTDEGFKKFQSWRDNFIKKLLNK